MRPFFGSSSDKSPLYDSGETFRMTLLDTQERFENSSLVFARFVLRIKNVVTQLQ